MREVYHDGARSARSWPALRKRLPVLLSVFVVCAVLGAGLVIRSVPSLHEKSNYVDVDRRHPSPPTHSLFRFLSDWRATAASVGGTKGTDPAPPRDRELEVLEDADRVPTPEGSGSSLAHLWGTDAVGRDLLLGAFSGASIYLAPGLCVAAIALLLGILIGGVSAFTRDRRLRVILELGGDSLGSLPKYVVLMVALSVWSISIWALAIPLGLLIVPRVAWVVAEKVRSLKEMEFLEAAEELGLSRVRILLRHVLWANCKGLIVSQAILAFADLILIETTLGYLGFGLESGHRSWGALIAEGARFQYLSTGLLWPMLYPTVILIVTILCLRSIAVRFDRDFG
jgi:ABC-type dipeptide/oligopeptide/nickel transport system permease subunit